VGSTRVSYTFTDSNNNSSSCYFFVIVNDNTPPTIATLCPADITVYTGPGNTSCRQQVSWTPPMASDNCGGAVSRSSNQQPGASFQVGTTPVVYTFRDVKNNAISCSFNVTVIDNTPPVALCKPFTLTLNTSGRAILNIASINNGSTDNCGIASRTLSRDTFTCADAGLNPIVLTVTDIHGNSSTCTAMVTVQYKPTCTIAVTPTDTTYTGGIPANIYLGYGPQSARATVTPGGGYGFTYSWSPSANLSCGSCANPVFTPKTAGNYTYTVTVKNSSGCATSCATTFCVKDVRVAGGDNVYVCHEGSSLSMTRAQAAAHLRAHPGDRMGACDELCSPTARLAGNESSSAAVEAIKVYPNPNSGAFVVELPATVDQGRITIMDLQGRLIASRSVTSLDGNKISFDLSEVARGLYLVHVSYGDKQLRGKLDIR
jgi:hypothetical protein